VLKPSIKLGDVPEARPEASIAWLALVSQKPRLQPFEPLKKYELESDKTPKSPPKS